MAWDDYTMWLISPRDMQVCLPGEGCAEVVNVNVRIGVTTMVERIEHTKILNLVLAESKAVRTTMCEVVPFLKDTLYRMKRLGASVMLDPQCVEVMVLCFVQSLQKAIPARDELVLRLLDYYAYEFDPQKTMIVQSSLFRCQFADIPHYSGNLVSRLVICRLGILRNNRTHFDLHWGRVQHFFRKMARICRGRSDAMQTQGTRRQRHRHEVRA